MIQCKIINKESYFYYPEDIYIAEMTGNKTVPAQDECGNEYTLVWTGQGIAVEEN